MKTSTVLTITRSAIHRLRNFSDKSCIENKHTLFVLRNFFPDNCAVYEIIRENIVQLDGVNMKI
jgi:hypothetical protein